MQKVIPKYYIALSKPLEENECSKMHKNRWEKCCNDVKIEDVCVENVSVCVYTKETINKVKKDRTMKAWKKLYLYYSEHNKRRLLTFIPF